MDSTNHVQTLRKSLAVGPSSISQLLAQTISEGLFIAASLFGLWLIQSLLQSSGKP